MPPRRRSRGHIEPLPSGKYRAIVEAGTDVLTGRRRQLKTTVDTKAEAQTELTRMQRQVDENKQPKTAITVAEAIEQWLEVAKLADTTRVRNVDLVRMYINPHLGHVQAGKLDAELLERLYAQLERCKDMCGRRPPKDHTCKGLSSSSTRKIHYIISGALSLAVRWNYLGVNPAELAHAPSPAKSKPDPPSAAEAAALLNEAWRDPEWGLLIWLTMVTGCRRGELCSLRWSDLDVEKSTLWVQRSTSQTRLGLKQKETKSDNRRRISLDAHTMVLLAEHHGRVVEQLSQLGTTGDDETFMFSSAPDYSTPQLPNSLTQRYLRMARRLKLRSTRLHALRHYSATELISAGVDLRTVAGRLGHGSGGATTLKVYAAYVEAADRKAADTMVAILPKPEPKPRAPRGPYESIAEALRADIAQGRLSPGDQIPTIVQLAAQYSVAAGTAHRAVSRLHDEGLIIVARGRRATVAATNAGRESHNQVSRPMGEGCPGTG